MRPLQDLLIYSESIERELRTQNDSLSARLRDSELDLDDAKKSRRDLQQQLHELESRKASLEIENGQLKVWTLTIPANRPPPAQLLNAF